MSLASTTISSLFLVISPKVIKTSSVAYSCLGCFSNITKDSLVEEEVSFGVTPLVAVEYAFPVVLETPVESDDADETGPMYEGYGGQAVDSNVD